MISVKNKIMKRKMVVYGWAGLLGLAFVVSACTPPLAVKVKGNYGTYEVNPDGLTIDIRDAK